MANKKKSNIKIAYEKCKKQLSHFSKFRYISVLSLPDHEGHCVKHGQQQGHEEVYQGSNWLHEKLNQPGPEST